MKVMATMLIVGLTLTAGGFYLAMFTRLASEGGIGGLFTIVSLITLGLLLLIPAKVYIIIRLTSRKPRAGPE